jgi:hypothetical protein
VKITALDIPQSVEELSHLREELPEGVAIEEVMPGLKQWRNPLNKFFVQRLHRTVDPAKRTQEWIDKTKAGLSTADWMREYELIWESLEGRPVYADEWSSEFHTSRVALGWNPNLVVCRGWDFGLYPATIFAQLFPHSRLLVLRECVGEDIDTERFIYEVARLSSEWFPGATFYEFIDPTGKNRAGTDGRSYTRLLTAKPLRAKRIIRGANSPVQRRTSVIDFLKDNVRGLPCLLIDPKCIVLQQGFDGGYHFPYRNGTLSDRALKNLFSHIHDALQYLCSMVRSTNLRLDTDSKVVPIEPRFGASTPPTIKELELEAAGRIDERGGTTLGERNLQWRRG